MKKTLLALATIILSLMPAFAQNGAFDMKDFISGGYAAQGIQGVIPIPGDGEHYSQMNSQRTQVIKYSYKTGEMTEVLFDVATARDCTFSSFDSYIFSPDGTKLLIATNTQSIYRRTAKADYYIYSLRRNTAGKIQNAVEKLSDGGPQMSPVFSPDGNVIAFARDNNIFLVKLLYGNSESQVTEDGKRNEIINGIPDWVYEEEFGFNCAMIFSQDSKMLAFIRFDESNVKEYSFPVFKGEAPVNTEYQTYPGAYIYKYPKTGQVNSKVSVKTFDIQTKVTRTMQVPLDEDGYIPRIFSTGAPSGIAIVTMNRHQNRIEIHTGDMRSTVTKMILRDESDAYIKEEVLSGIKFFNGNNFSFLSDKSGFMHLYWYNINGVLSKQVTSGNYEVTSFLGYNPQEESFYYASNEGSPLRSAVYKMDKKGKKTRLTPQEGTNSAQFSTDFKYFMNRYSNLNTPTVITLCDATGKVLKTLVDNHELKSRLESMNLPKKEFFTFTTSLGDELNGWIIKPSGFNPSQKYPVILTQYSGPGSQEVKDAYGVSWDDYMATQGYVICCVDGRGTGGRGAAFEKCTYMNLGVKEARDQVETALYMGKQSYVDAARIGIWGWSYGGYMTLMSISEGTPVFRAAVSVAPVTDWRYYDTVYGERYMRTPQENADGYDAASCFTRADKLSGDLLLIHGMADDNVHFQNSAEYAERLVQLGKQFQMQVYTNRNHSIRGGGTSLHLYTRIKEFFDSKLKN